MLRRQEKLCRDLEIEESSSHDKSPLVPKEKEPVVVVPSQPKEEPVPLKVKTPEQGIVAMDVDSFEETKVTIVEEESPDQQEGMKC